MEELKQNKFYLSIFITMFLLNWFLPAGTVITSVFGYTFELFNYFVIGTITTVFSLFFMIFTIRKRSFVKKCYKKSWFVFLSIGTFINYFFYCLNFEHESTCMIVIFSLIMIVNFVFTVILNLSLSDTKAKLIVNIIAVSVLVIPLCFYSFFTALIGGMGYVKVVRSVPSPNGEYVAEILDINQGDLGGDTVVQINENKGLNCFVLKIEKKPNRIYYGEWGEFETIDVSWENEEFVLIDSVRYRVK